MQIPYEGQSSRARTFDFWSQHINDSSEDDQAQSEIDSKESIIIDVDFNTTNFHSVSIMTLTTIALNPPNDPLQLIYLELIHWEQIELLNIPIFQDDEAIVHYLCSVNTETCSTSESHNEFIN